MNSPSLNNEWIWGIAIIVLGIALAYGLNRSGGRSPPESKRADEATRKNYREEDT